LYCPQNSLTSLPQLPDSMSYLVCAYNQITSIPPLPSVIRVFSCTSNSLTELPTLPNSLQHLECNSNPQLSELPILPHTLAHLNVGWCNLTVLPAFPDSLGQCDLRGNPIKCLPELKKIKYLWFSNTNITCIPNYIDIYSSTPALNSLPICDVFNDNSCPVLSSISGKVHKSNDADCVFGQGDVQAHNVKVQLWRNGNIFKQNLPHLSTYTFKTEVFSVYQVTVDTLNTPFRIKCPAIGSLTSIISNTDSVDYNMDFALECKPGFDVEAKSMFGAVFRPANTTHVQIAAGDASNFYGAHCSAGVSGSVALSYTGPLSYGGPASGALTPTLSGNTLIWNVADFDNVNFSTDFDVIMQTDTNAQIGQLVSFTLTANPIAGDNNPANNTLTIDFPVVNSYDPNDKQVSPPGNIDTLQEYLTYTVRFQNTGNAEAQHVYITDTLDGDIEPASFQLLAYSHQPMVQIDGNAVKFNFPNINLPDSFSNEPGSHGYVQYKVKLNDNLPIGTTINNTAFIYFDFNSPVVTNTTTNTVSLDADTTVVIHLIIADAQVFVYPNPANSAVTITVSENMQGGVVTLTDMLGRNAIEPVQLNGRAVTMNTEQLPEGVYLVNVQGRGGVSVVKRLVVKK
jgi:uncharacterized repeat protein (TIGR01451 family)